MTPFKLLALSCAFIAALGGLPQASFARDGAIYRSMDLAHPEWARHGMVVSQEAYASKIGLQILQQGGNAVDAAVAVGFGLAVTLPRAGNLGGGGFMMVHMARENITVAIDYREMAPARAHRDMYLDEQGNADPRLSQFHGLSVGVPGTVMGLELALKEYGTMTLPQVMAPAIELAEQGFIVNPGLAGSLRGLKKRLAGWPSTREIFYKDNGENYRPGDRLVQADLAQSLRIIAAEGSKGFYHGPLAEKIAAAVVEAGGVMTIEDLANYTAVIREPVTGTYRGYDIASMPPPSSGGTHIIEILNIMEGYPVTELGHNSAATIHLMAEAMKRAYADRSKYLGDPDFVTVPTTALTDKSYAAHLRQTIDQNRATPSKSLSPGQPAPYESNETTHYSVVDKWGNVVSNTYTLNFSYGSGLVARGTGILLNNEMDDFSAKPGVPNGYGLIGGDSNAVAAGKRPLSSMSPTIVFKDGKPFLVTGSPGGSRIITSTLQVIMNVIDHGMNIAEATNSTRIHHQWFPDQLRIEKNLSPDTIQLLRDKGQNVVVRSSMGSTQSIMITPEGLYGASDPRLRGALVAGY
ncbi:MAG: gamma-glutamyltransferase [Alphaproteobacteria bacterium]|nr:MAG: gamma-glutamyltransferase [Alphaproteobacteria bacterium]